MHRSIFRFRLWDLGLAASRHQTPRSPATACPHVCCNFLRYCVSLMCTVQLTCCCLCCRCLIHEIWIIKAGSGAAACSELLWRSVSSWRICCCLSFWKATLFDLSVLLCVNPRGDLHHTQLWFRATFDLHLPAERWRKNESCLCQITWC